MATHNNILFNGEIVPFEDARIHILAPAVQYAAVVFEGLRAYWSEEKKQLFLFRLDEHVQRLELSMKIMRFERPAAMDTLQADIIKIAKANGLKEDSHMRIFAYLDGPPNITATGPVRMAITAGPFPKNEFVDKGMACAVSSWARLSDRSSPPRVKTVANYVNGRLAATQAKTDGYDASIMLSDAGYVSEGPQANLFMVRDGRVLTPRLTDGILESITRRTLIDLFRDDHGIETQERAIDRTELYAAEEMFYCGSGWEVRPITSIDRLPVGDGKVGPIARKIINSYFACVRGENAKRREWLVPVW